MRKIVLSVRAEPPGFVKRYMCVFAAVILGGSGQLKAEFPEVVVLLQPLLKVIHVLGRGPVMRLRSSIFVVPSEFEAF